MAQTRDTAKGTYGVGATGPGGATRQSPRRATCRRVGSQPAEGFGQDPRCRAGGCLHGRARPQPRGCRCWGGPGAPPLRALGLPSCRGGLRSFPLGILVQTGSWGGSAWTQGPAAGTLWQRRAGVSRVPEESPPSPNLSGVSGVGAARPRSHGPHPAGSRHGDQPEAGGSAEPRGRTVPPPPRGHRRDPTSRSRLHQLRRLPPTHSLSPSIGGGGD